MDKKIIAYSLLAQINNKSDHEGTYDSIFIPLIKRGISKMCASGKTKGDDIKEIVNYIEELYNLKMPDPVLKRLLRRIENEINITEQKIKFYEDWSYVIQDYLFDEYEEDILIKENQIEKLQKIYNDFLVAEKIELKPESIFEFVEQAKASLGKYIHKKFPVDHSDHTIEAKFINFIKPIEGCYQLLQSIYIGSIISTYLEYEPSSIKKNVELVFDTNFIISLLDLNTASSTHSCRRLLEISSKLGYKFTVLSITLKEIDGLLSNKVIYFNDYFLLSLADPEDIYNACKRRGLTKTDLDKIRIDIKEEISKFKVTIIENVEKYQNKAKFSDEYEKLREIRNTLFAALHDATCIEYVKSARGKILYNYEKVNCWFLNNSSSRGAFSKDGSQPVSIKSEDLLNLLWLTSPMVKKEIKSDDFTSIGLSRLVATTLDDALPKSITIKELDDNIKKYAVGEINDEDIVRVAKSIAERTVHNLDNLNRLAKDNHKEFIDTLQNIADEMKKKEEGLTNLINKAAADLTLSYQELRKEIEKTQEERSGFDKSIVSINEKYVDSVSTNSDLVAYNRKLKKELIDERNKERERLRKHFIKNEVKKWRRKSWLEVISFFLLLIIIYVFYSGYHGWDFTYLTDKTKSNNLGQYILFITGAIVVLLSVFFIPSMRDKYRSPTAIDKFEQRLTIPEELRSLPYEEV